ncbi:MAG: sensor histidine kinase [Telluria sp.]
MVLFILCSFPTLSFGVPVVQKSVLVLSTDSFTHPYIFKFFSAFDTTLKQGQQGGVAIHSESLDLARLSTNAYREKLHAMLEEKYRNADINVVVVFGNGALRYLLESNPRLWPGVPVVFANISSGVLGQAQLPPDVTGTAVGLYMSNTVQLAKSLFPGTKRIALIGNTPENDQYRPYFAADLAPLYEQVEFIDLRGKPVEQVMQQVAALPDDAVIFSSPLFDDGTGRKFIPSDILKAIMQGANRPVLVDNETVIGSGVLGGIVFDPASQGRAAAMQARRLLRGEAAAAIPIGNDVSRPVFDWRQLERWGVGRAALPPDSEIRFYEPGLWERYRWQLAGIVAALVLQAIFLAVLLAERRRRAGAEQVSRRRLAEMAHMNRTTTATVFSSAIVHELNQPLAAILSNAEAAEMFLNMDPPAIGEVQAILEDICQDDRRASELIQRMHGLLKKTESTIQHIDLNDTVEHSVKFLAAEARTRGIVVTAQLSHQPLPVFADRVQLQQVMINLIVNGMDALHDTHGPERRISVKTAIADGMAEVCVSDSGPGFVDRLDRVFESFFTTKSHGLGLGLSISAEIIRAHGGQIRAENNPGGGATVRFNLPLDAESEA